jgi:60 kDa SS-A/Ro ribonucleoprotein
MTFKYLNQKISVENPIVGRKEMVQTNGGGYAFKIDDLQMLDRFLSLGATSGTYYISKEKVQYTNTENIVSCIQSAPNETLDRIVEVSSKGLAHKNDHAIYALALVFVHGDNSIKTRAVAEFSKVVRTATHLFMFCAFIKEMRGFGKLVRQAINNWYVSKDTKSFAYQVSKYQQRDGWSHKDVFCLTHPKFGKTTNMNKIAKWAMGNLDTSNLKPSDDGLILCKAVDDAKHIKNAKELVDHISNYKLQREHIPTEFLNKPEIQEALLPHMNATALIRSLSVMTASGLISPLSSSTKYIVDRLNNKDWLRGQRIHPLSILVANRIYGQGRGLKGSLTWNTDRNILDALENAFYNAFDAIQPTNKNYMYGIDVSGSMSSQFNDTPLRFCEVAAVLAMAHVRTEPWTFVGGFASNFVDLKISSKDTLKSATEKCLKNNFGSTNPSAVLSYAKQNKMDVDCFIIITDNEVNSGNHVSSKLKSDFPKSKMIVCGLAVNNFSIADPKNPNMLDIAGFSPEITSAISSFTRS